MKVSRYAVAASLAAILGAGAGGAFAAAPAKLSGHIVKWLDKSAKVGVANEGQVVRLRAFLGFRNADALQALITRQSTPGSADYERYLTAAQFHARFSPPAQDAAKVEDGLRAFGFTVTGKPASNLYVEFKGTVAQVKAAFGVSQNLYAYQGKVMRANAEDPRLPASLSGLVTILRGLDDGGQLIHPFHHSINDEAQAAAKASARTAFASSARTSPSATLPTAGNLPSPYCSTYYGDTVATLSTAAAPYPTNVPWLVCGYTPQQMQAAYGANKSTMDGTGVTVAIVDAYTSPTLLDDANRYSANHKLPKLKSGRNFQSIYPGDISTVPDNDPCEPQGWFGEISLDVDAVHGMAPGAKVLYSGAASCQGADLDAAINAVVDGTEATPGPLADIITNSYGDNGEPSQAEQTATTQVLQQAAAEGVTVVFSSGDNGDLALKNGYAEASWPASSPLVTAVGGTSLALLDAKGRKSEWGWGTFRANLTGVTVNSASSVTDSGFDSFTFYIGAGGGPSFYQPEPDYQVGIVPSKIGNRTYDLKGKHYAIGGQARVTPDVSMDADPYTGFIIGESFTIAGDPISDAGCTPTSSTTEYCEASIGGTSLASPLFAGTLALVTQYRRTNNAANLGLVNAKLYGLPVGNPGSGKSAIVDVQAPATPTAVLRGYANNLNKARIVTINSTPGPFGPLCTTSFCNGQDSWILQTTPKWDDVTGVGVPFVPQLLTALGGAPSPQ